MEFHHQFWYRNFRGRFSRVVFVAILFLLDEILQSSPVPMTVKYLFHFPLWFSVDDYGRWVIHQFPSWNWVVWSQSELYYVEHWVKLLHPVWQF